VIPVRSAASLSDSGSFRDEIDLRLAPERKAEVREQIHAAVPERREDPIALAGGVGNGHVVVLDAAHRVSHRDLLLERRCDGTNHTPNAPAQPE
jgi:hypothetical protein